MMVQTWIPRSWVQATGSKAQGLRGSDMVVAVLASLWHWKETDPNWLTSVLLPGI